MHRLSRLFGRLAFFAVALQIGSVSAADERTSLSGRQLLELCSAKSEEQGSVVDCEVYFRATLDAFDEQAGRPARLHYCLPQGFDVPQLIDLYKLESMLYPHVLHVPAERLIVGMVLKFYPCRAT